MKAIDRMLGRAVIVVILAGFALLFNAGMAKAENECHFLYVIFGVDRWEFEKVSCSKGKVQAFNPRQIIVKQSGGRGPKCQVHMRSGGASGLANLASVMEVQQDLCVMKAGGISVSNVSGLRPRYRRNKGSFKNNRPGSVTVVDMLTP